MALFMLTRSTCAAASRRLPHRLERPLSTTAVQLDTRAPIAPNVLTMGLNPHTGTTAASQGVPIKGDFNATAPPNLAAQLSPSFAPLFEPVRAPGTDLFPVAVADTVTAEDRLFMKQDPLLSQIVNTLMRDGKKMRTQRHIGEALIEIRKLTNSNPYTVLRDAMEKCSPLMDLRSKRVGSKIVYVPRPLTSRQRIRRALLWIYKASKSRPERTFPMRFAHEILMVINGNSTALVSKFQLHKDVLANRSNIQS
ncbi:hypothetical protein H4R34_002294 [Dimargaris verticillata]|uniref:Small ribosomal subunit protein uS7 domain-containing protein n=1 Tax=Dimargaris verticillata TaxID=2761393 RepID=A0A9W8B6T6_9FUNG|nr:hypothetical protein H4R34_002294 [Dimargaris verticillata]